MNTNMNPIEMNHYRRILEARVFELEQVSCRRDAIQVEKTADSAERMADAVERELAVRALDTQSMKLREARAALARIADKSYGICEECEGRIGAARLKAMPSAALCIRCQEASDCGGYSMPLAA